MPLFTILIPVCYHEHKKLLRLVAFLETFSEDFDILILDSSLHQLKVDKPENCRQVFFDHKIELAEKLNQGIGMVLTKYSVICADDDFINPTSVNACVNFLEHNPDYVVAHGRYISFVTEKNRFFWNERYQTSSIEDSDPIIRVEAYFKTLEPNFYGVYRTSQHREILQLIASSTYDPRFFEILQATIAMLIGKEKKLDFLYYAREKAKRKTRLANIDSFIKRKTFDEKYYLFKEGLNTFLKSNKVLNLTNFNEQIDRIFFNFLNRLQEDSSKKSLIDRIKFELAQTKYFYNFLRFIFSMGSVYEKTMKYNLPQNADLTVMKKIKKYAFLEKKDRSKL